MEVSQIQKTIFKIELKFHGKKKIKIKTKQIKSNQEPNNIGLNKYWEVFNFWSIGIHFNNGSQNKKRWKFSKIIELILTQVTTVFFKSKEPSQKRCPQKCQFFASYLKLLKNPKPEVIWIQKLKKNWFLTKIKGPWKTSWTLNPSHLLGFVLNNTTRVVGAYEKW